MKTKLGIAVLLLILFGCSGKLTHHDGSKPAFIGCWEQAEKPGLWIEFAKDGKYDVSSAPFDLQGRWRRDNDKLHVTTCVYSFSWKWRMEGDRLVLTDEDGTRKLRRVAK